MPNLVALSLMVSDKKIFKDFKKNYVLLPWQPEFLKQSNSFKNSKEDHGRNISVKFHQNPVVSEKMFKEKVNARTDALMHGWTHDGQRTMT